MSNSVENILTEAWPQENIHEAMEEIQPHIRRSEKTCNRINFKAARRKAIAWRAAILRGEKDAKPPQFRSRIATTFTPRIGGSSPMVFGQGLKTARPVSFGGKRNPEAPVGCGNCGAPDHERQDCLKPPMKREGKR